MSWTTVAFIVIASTCVIGVLISILTRFAISDDEKVRDMGATVTESLDMRRIAIDELPKGINATF